MTADTVERATVALENPTSHWPTTSWRTAPGWTAHGSRRNSRQTILARQSPVATDLRVVLAAVHALTELERMGRLAVHVAEAVQRRYPHQVVPHVLTPRFVEMGRIAVWLAVLTGQVMEKRDVTLARSLISVALLSRYSERFADHAVSLARQTTFVVTGKPKWADAA